MTNGIRIYLLEQASRQELHTIGTQCIRDYCGRRVDIIHLKYCFILQQTLEDKDRKVAVHRETLLREQRYLRRRVELLSNQMDAIHKRRSVSECSATSTGSSTGSTGSSESGRIHD